MVAVKELTKKELIEQRKERTHALVAKLAKFVKVGHRSAWNDSGFTIGLNRARTGIEVYAGDANITVAGSTKHHQVVINVKEEAHTITEVVTGMSGTKAEVIKRAEQGERFPVAFENWDEVVFEADRQTTNTYKNAWEETITDVTVTAHVPEHSLCLLAGQDEKFYFISPLRKSVATVAEAHEELRPATVPAETLRIGEWFFVPVDEKKSLELDKHAAEVGKISFEEYSNHFGISGLLYRKGASKKPARASDWSEAREGDTVYVCGFVLDEMERHSPIWLPDWHLVVRNNEDAELAWELGDGAFD